MTARDILTLARSFVGDESTDMAAQRRRDEWFVPHINAALRLLWDRAPVSRLDATGLANRVYAEFDGVDWDASIWPDDQWKAALAHYLAFVVFTNDAGDTRDSLRAKAHQTACSPLAD